MRVELDRQSLLLLILVGVLLLLVIFYVLPSDGPASAADGAPARPPPVSGPPGGFTHEGLATDVDLEGLTATRPAPLEGERNPFRFDVRRVAPPAVERPPIAAAAPFEPAPPIAESAPPAAAAIPLKFIGLVEAPGGRGRFAVLSDGRFVHHGREGAIIDGRYRIVRIGVESIELEHVDGRGRQTLRLTG